MVSELRPDEDFAIRAVAASASGKWWPGDNPPDAYLRVGERIIGVEISTLTQHVNDGHGGTHARLSEDVPAIAMANQLDRDLRDVIPDGRMAILTLRTPILEVRQTMLQLKEKICRLVEAASSKTVDVEENICGNTIGIQITSHEEPDPRKIHALVPNRKSSPNVLSNARYILEERIVTKAKKCGSLNFEGPLWLALINDYWLADSQTYQKAMAMIPSRHPFERILLISGNGFVAALYG